MIQRKVIINSFGFPPLRKKKKKKLRERSGVEEVKSGKRPGVARVEDKECFGGQRRKQNKSEETGPIRKWDEDSFWIRRIRRTNGAFLSFEIISISWLDRYVVERSEISLSLRCVPLICCSKHCNRSLYEILTIYDMIPFIDFVDLSVK